MSEPQPLLPFHPFAGRFPDRLAPAAFASRSTLFSDIVSRTHDHFWDPDDPAYIDFDTPFDLASTPVMPFSMIPELRSDVAERLTPRQRIAFANDSAHWWLSGFLHGEQGALHLSVSLCGSLGDAAAVEYAANQAREEARHVAAFTRYISARWGEPQPVNPVFAQLLDEIVSSPRIHRKIVGMQVLVEGLAMGFMAQLHQKSNDPVLVRLAQLVMADETFHHKVGRLWTRFGLPTLSPEDRDDAEDFALACFQRLVLKVFNPEQKAALYARHGLDTEDVRAALQQVYADESRRAEMAGTHSVFRMLVRTLVDSGLVTARTRADYARWVDLDALGAEALSPVEDAIASEGLAFLKRVNDARRDRRHPDRGREAAMER